MRYNRAGLLEVVSSFFLQVFKYTEIRVVQ